MRTITVRYHCAINQLSRSLYFILYETLFVLQHLHKTFPNFVLHTYVQFKFFIQFIFGGVILAAKIGTAYVWLMNAVLCRYHQYTENKKDFFILAWNLQSGNFSISFQVQIHV